MKYIFFLLELHFVQVCIDKLHINITVCITLNSFKIIVSFIHTIHKKTVKICLESWFLQHTLKKIDGFYQYFGTVGTLSK